MKKISILGCGWLGFPLAKKLILNGSTINGSTTTLAKIPILQNAGIAGFIISVTEDKVDGNLALFLEDSEVLIIDFPPKLRGENSENFVSKIKNLIPFIEKSSVKTVIFVSSTSVYPDDLLLSNYDENKIPQPDSESGKQLLEAENHLKNSRHFKTIVVRFAGLFGEDRHPIKFLAGRKNLENPDGPINLIHLKDCIGILEAIIFKELQHDEYDAWELNGVFNAVAPFHPTRKEYYTQKAIELNVPLPEFDESKLSVGKIIDSDKITALLNYKFQIIP